MFYFSMLDMNVELGLLIQQNFVKNFKQKNQLFVYYYLLKQFFGVINVGYIIYSGVVSYFVSIHEAQKWVNKENNILFKKNISMKNFHLLLFHFKGSYVQSIPVCSSSS